MFPFTVYTGKSPDGYFNGAHKIAILFTLWLVCTVDRAISLVVIVPVTQWGTNGPKTFKKGIAII